MKVHPPLVKVPLISNHLHRGGKLAIEIDGGVGFFRLGKHQPVDPPVSRKLCQVMARAGNDLGIILRRKGICGFQFTGVELKLPLRQLSARRIDIPACRPGTQENG